MKNKLFYVIAFSIVFFNVIQSSFAQNNIVYGYVRDKNTGEALIGATVFNIKSKNGVVANSYGFYSLKNHESDSLIVRFSYTGYTSAEFHLKLQGDTTLNINLVPGKTLDEVNVFAEIPLEKRNDIGVAVISNKEISSLPNIAGEADLLRAYQLLPGVQRGAEGTAGLFVRGGSSDQNLIIIDDVPLYYVDHLGGFVSIFNSDIINDAKLIKGGFSARYGGRLSSVLDIKMKEGNKNEFKACGTISPITTKAMVEGPLFKGKASYIVSARRFMYDLLTRPISMLLFDGVSIGYTFYDFNAKINYNLSHKDRLFFSGYRGNDSYITTLKDKSDSETSEYSDKLRWGNTLGAFRWNHIFNRRFFSNTTFTVSKYNYSTAYSSEYTYSDSTLSSSNQNKFVTGIWDSRAKVNLEYLVSNCYNISLGADLVYHIFEPGVTSFGQEGTNLYDTVFGQSTIPAFEKAVFLENELNTQRFGFNIGARISQYSVEGVSYNSFEPRVLLRVNIVGNSLVKLSYSKMKQYIHLISYAGVGLPANYWLPSTKKIPPSASQQFSLGYYQSCDLFEFSTEAYYKKMDNLTDFSEGASFFGSTSDWQDKLETGGIGKAYGIEFLAQKKYGQLTGWVGYALSKNERKFDNINNGDWYPYQYDRRHKINVALMYQLNDKIDFSLTWEYSSGRPITIAVGRYYAISDPETFYGSNDEENELIPDEEVELFDGINSYRMTAFHKLDLGMNYRKMKGTKEITWNFSIYNAYNHQNAYYYYWQNTCRGYKLYQSCVFPIIPSVSYSVRF